MRSVKEGRPKNNDLLLETFAFDFPSQKKNLFNSSGKLRKKLLEKKNAIFLRKKQKNSNDF